MTPTAAFYTRCAAFGMVVSGTWAWQGTGAAFALAGLLLYLEGLWLAIRMECERARSRSNPLGGLDLGAEQLEEMLGRLRALRRAQAPDDPPAPREARHVGGARSISELQDADG